MCSRHKMCAKNSEETECKECQKKQIFKPLDDFLKRKYESLKFKCKYEKRGCPDQAYNFEAMLKHMDNCKFQYFKCPNKCFQKLPENSKSIKKAFPREMKAHLKECPARKVKCEECSMDYLVAEKHECFSSMLEMVQKQNTEIQEIHKSLGTNYDELQPKCIQGHMMIKNCGPVINYKFNVKCNKCKSKQLERFEYFYYCKICRDKAVERLIQLQTK